jgi:CRISPR system Cascade subunit CasE
MNDSNTVPRAGGDHPVLARARLRRDTPIQALAQVLVPSQPGARCGVSHSLVWALFADDQERRRDFLWRETRPGEFLILAARPPRDLHGLFDLESKPFVPALCAGQRLHFDLRANPVISVWDGMPGERGKRHDVVMHALSQVPSAERRALREATMREAGYAWIARQGAAAGFSVDPDELCIDHYEQVRIPREEARDVRFSALTFQGVLTVDEPERFQTSLRTGFGAAKAFGCGLMLIRRAPLWP